MRRLIISGKITQELVRRELPRASQSVDAVTRVVSELCEDVRLRSVEAVRDHALKFDGVSPKNFRVLQSDLDLALENLNSDLCGALEIAISRVKEVSLASLPKDFDVDLALGARVTQRFVPVDSVGLYVPGGKAVYPSSVVMNVVAAQAAKVPRIAIASPAQKDFGGLPHPSILAAAALLGIKEVYAIGGATAVAAFAYGIPEIGLQPVRMVTGPGNVYVATAKRVLRGLIGIDSEAGPTEILIIADETANPAFIAADLISQAEHDENAAAVLVTNSIRLIQEVERELSDQLESTTNRKRVETALGGVQSALVLTDSLEVAIEIANEYATEHLEIHTSDDQAVLRQITNAGAIFLGSYSPVSLGDYLAGSNHVLPTGEQAKFGPGLGVHSFLRPQQVIHYSKDALGSVVKQLEILAQAEGLQAHGDAGRVRFLES